MAIRLNRPSPEWVQLTYASADPVRGAKGGWGIQETSPGASDGVIAQLNAGVTTRIVEVDETSQFASDVQLRARPRRLTYRDLDGRTSLWHAASAGPDATGRPGNVFTHAASRVSPWLALRPIEYWRSEDWLAPFGPAAVTAVRLGDLRPGAVVTRESAMAFAKDRRVSLEWLLAAVSSVESGHRSLALAVDSPDEGAHWLGAISFLTAPAFARRVSWVTFERAAGVEEVARRGITIICVPRADLAALLESPPAGVLIVDPTWELDESNGDTWTTPLGEEFAVDTRWQSAMLDVLALDDVHTLRVLVEMDVLTAGIQRAGARELPLHWPLTMALLTDGEATITERDKAIHECVGLAPASLAAIPAVQRLMGERARDLTGRPILEAAGTIAEVQARAETHDSVRPEQPAAIPGQQATALEWRGPDSTHADPPVRAKRALTDIAAAITAILKDAEPLSERAKAIAECLHIVHRLEPKRSRDLAAALSTCRDLPEDLRDRIEGWLVELDGIELRESQKWKTEAPGSAAHGRGTHGD